jgi:Domain of unknown function (DUF4169)
MVGIVNLNRARKAKARTEAEGTAAANRAKHGRTAAERNRDERAEARRRALLDGAKLDDAGSDTPKDGGR